MKERLAIIRVAWGKEILLPASDALKIAALLDGQETVRQVYGLYPSGEEVYERCGPFDTQISLPNYSAVYLTPEEVALEKAEQEEAAEAAAAVEEEAALNE